MAFHPHRLSGHLSLNSAATAPPPAVRELTLPQQLITTNTLVESLHTTYVNRTPLLLESSSHICVNTWVTASTAGPDGCFGGVVSSSLAVKAWEHARRRAEDNCILLSSLHDSTPSLFATFLSTLPFSLPSSIFTALLVLKPLTHCVTPSSPSLPCYSSLACVFSLSLSGSLLNATLKLSSVGLNVKQALLDLPSLSGYRAFDVFYYLNTPSASPAEREALNLRQISSYTLLKKSNTFSPPTYTLNADDSLAAEDFRKNLKALGIKGLVFRNFISVLAGILKLGDVLDKLVTKDIVEQVCEDAASLLDLDASVLLDLYSSNDLEVFISGLYESLVDWVIAQANNAIKQEIQAARNPFQSEANSPDAANAEDCDTVDLTIVDIPSLPLSKAVALRVVFDENEGLTSEMVADDIPHEAVSPSIINEMNAAVSTCEYELNLECKSQPSRDKAIYRDRCEATLEKVVYSMQGESFLKELLLPIPGQGIVLGKAGRFELTTVLECNRIWFHLCAHSTDEDPATLANGGANISPAAISRQVREWRLVEWVNRRVKKLDYTADFDIDEFVARYSRLGCKEGRDGVENWIMERGWSNNEVILGRERVWMREGPWWEAESMLDMKPLDQFSSAVGCGNSTFGMINPINGSSAGGMLSPRYGDHMTLGGGSRLDFPVRSSNCFDQVPSAHSGSTGDYGLGSKGDHYKGVTFDGDPEMGSSKIITHDSISRSRRVWVWIVRICTFWIPSPFLRYIGRMKRPDVRMAWREKLTLIMIIFLLNALVVFYIIEFGKLLCPNYDKAWNAKEVSFHQGDDDFWVSHSGKVYDISKFWRIQHSDTAIETTRDNMQPFAGTNVDPYIRPPLTIACPFLVKDVSVQLDSNTTIENPSAIHATGPFFQNDRTTKLHSIDWYTQTFLPRMREYFKGDLVVDPSVVKKEGVNYNHPWVILFDKVYDFTDYFFTLKRFSNLDPRYHFLDADVEAMIKNNPGMDISELWTNTLNRTTQGRNKQCFDNYFYVGRTDFRKSVKCQINNYLLLAFTIILCSVILVKFLAALQLGSKRRPAQQDKFVICQVPAYTEGEEQLRKGLDSLTALEYDNKRKLIFVICDGLIVGGGNDRPTPKIVLDILGVDPKTDPPALPFRSVGQGNEQLNYGKVYSGLYEYEGNVVPYIVVVKVGKNSEQGKSKPGNRGKRDSQILLMSFLNRVHHRAPMNPLELELFYQINNIIGVDPELYEYLLMVDADTMVKEDSLNRLVASCANDAKIAGICGETSLENEERSWWTMIQVYEYYISHHLAKAFESLFGSVTCLPGCFCMYRLRTADKGKPLIISDAVIREYADCNVDTLHKKNLLSLGEDRYLTTLMTKHFPSMSYKFIPDAYALTAAPERWSVLLSQRRRWINSTIHNLVELIFLRDLCGFCCFSMRFVVLIDLFGTIILPATCAYLVYLIYRVATNSGQIPYISLAMLGAVYGLQAVIFIIKRQWQHIGWMIIYILAFPIYSFILPIYSFWKQDDFSWGNTRVVIGEKGDKKVVSVDNEEFDPRSIPLQSWQDYAEANEIPRRRGYSCIMEKNPFY